ncbi:MAG: C10 family peptidase [Bacteroidales bacterium]|nr:C10 family peptidase [Bacteroidales bacterium]
MSKKTVTRSLFFLAIFLSSICVNSFANPIGEQQARIVAQNFLLNMSPTPIESLTNITDQTPWHEFYIFSFENSASQRGVQNTGFVIVSADDCVIPILGYSLTNRFETTNMPPQLYNWLQGYEEQIAWWREHPDESSLTPASDPNAPLQNWSRLMSNRTEPLRDRLIVGPLLTTQWDQSPYYNLNCPYESSNASGHAPTGCVATAVAQIMKYWNHPATGYGSHNYTHDTYGYQNANFDTIYNWNLMPKKLTASTTSDSIQAVAMLIYHIGVAVEMNYGSDGSSATIYHNYNLSNQSAEIALRTYFKYKSSIHQIVYNDYRNHEWKNMLRDELLMNRPLLYRGKNDNIESSHAFVCDGYNSSTGEFHFNWGWGGSANGDYAIGSLNPTSTRHYNTNNVAVIGIEPNDDWGTSTTVTATANNSSFGSVTGGGTYAFGQTVTLEAQAVSGTRFDGWSDGYKYNPRQFVASGGNLNFTAKFRNVTGDTLTYCTGNSYNFGFGNNSSSSTNYWGVKFPANVQTPGNKLREVQLFVRSAGNYTLRVYYGSVNSSGLKRTQSFTVTESEVNSWKTVTLDSPYEIAGTAVLYITFSTNATYPGCCTYFSGNSDARLWGSSYNPASSTTKSSWMIKAITSADVCNAVSTFPFTENFEDNTTCWNFVNGNSANRWVIGTAANIGSGGGHSMYVSNDNGISNAYSLDVETPGVMAYKTLLLDARDYRISYNWEAYGQTDCDYLRVALVPANISLNVDDFWGYGNLPSGYIPLDGNSQLTQIFPFVTRTDTVSIPTAGYYNLVFYWTNDGNIGNGMNTPATIDNISIDITGRQVATVPYHEDFEGDVSDWCFINGDYLNQWHIDTAANNTTNGHHALYISNDGGNSYTYSNSGATSTVLAYRTLHLEKHYYTISFDWKASGQSSYDYLRAALVPESADLSATSWGTGSLPEGYISLDNNNILYNHNYWTTRTTTIGIPEAGEYRLVFYWCNNNSAGAQPPAAIDNVTVKYPIEIQGDIVSYCGDRTRSNYIGNGGITNWGISFTPLELADFNYLKSVLLYTTDPGTYIMTIYNGNDTLPVTPIYTNSYQITTTEDSYKRCDLDVPLEISRTDHLWVTFYNSDIAYPANACSYTGDPHSNWFSGDEGISWTPLHEAPNPLQYSWMIMIVTSETINGIICDTIRSFPYTDDFEESSTCWNFANGNYTNQWVIGSTVNNTTGGNQALYISTNCGIDNAYITNGEASIVKAYRTLQLDANCYTVSFDWKSKGEVDWDYLHVALLPASAELNTTAWGSIPGFISLDGRNKLCNQTSWITYTAMACIPSAGYYNLVFYWRNDNVDGNNPPAAIDNVVVKSIPYADAISDTFYEDFETGNVDNKWSFLNGNYINQWTIGSAVNNTPDGNKALYISNDGGTTNAYTNQNGASYVKAFRPFRFEAQDYTISFDWKYLGNGNSYGNYAAFMRAALVPLNALLEGTAWGYNTLPSGHISLDGDFSLCQNTSWSTYTTNVSIPTAGIYSVVFYWENRSSNSNYNPPAAIDNISIAPTHPTNDTVLAPPFTMDFENNETNGAVHLFNGNNDSKWLVDTAANNTPGGNHALYISHDYGITNTVGLHSTSSVIAYLPVELEAREYTIHFDWRGEGWNEDIMRVALIYDSLDLSCDVNNWYQDALPVGYTAIGGTNLIGQTDWTTLSTQVLVPVAGKYKLVFYWYNQYYYHTNGYRAAAVDNIVFDTVPGNIISFCGDNAQVTNLHITNSEFNWGICFTPEQMSRHNYLQGVRLYTDEYVFSEGSDDVTLNIYYGNNSEPTTLLYSRSYTIDDYEGYKYLALDSIIAIDHTKHLWITFHRDQSAYISACNGWEFNNSNWIGSGDYWQIMNSYYWMIQAVVRSSDVIHEGDTISYCGSDPYQNTVGMGNTNTDFYWGIRIPAAHLAGQNSIEDVLIYINGNSPGNYTLRIHQGNQTSSQNLLFIQTYTFTSDLNQYKSCTLPNPINIDNTQDLWVTFYNNGITYPAAGSIFTGVPNSDLLSNDGITWRHAYTNHNLVNSWMIKAVTSESVYTFVCDTITVLPHTFDFEGDSPLNCWEIFDGDNDGENWFLAGYSPSANGGAMCIASTSPNSISGAPIPDNWIITPAIHFPADTNILLSWYERISIPEFPGEHYGVYISNGSTDTSDFNLLQQFTVTNEGWNQRRLYLDAYAGQTVRLAFRHFNSANQNSLLIDDISIALYTPTAPSITINGSSTVRPGTSVTYTAIVDQEADITWLTEGTFPTHDHIGPEISVVWFDEGTYLVIATASNIHGSTSDTLLVTVSDCINVSTTYEVTACDSYTWNGITYISNAFITETYTTAFGCDSTVSIDLTLYHSATTYDTLHLEANDLPFQWNGNTINASGDYTATYTTSHGCDSIMHLHVIVNQVGIDNVKKDDKVVIYPNPTSGIVTIKAEGIIKVEVFDMLGHYITSVEKDNTIDLKDVPQGLYTLRITLIEGTLTRKIVIIR